MPPRSIAMRLQGLDKVRAGLEGMSAQHPEAVARALYQVGMQVGNQAVRNAPVLYGMLRSSAYVAPPGKVGDQTAVEIGFGTVYAAYQHEGAFKHPRGGEQHYLQKAVMALATLDKLAAFAQANIASGKGTQATGGGHQFPPEPRPNASLHAKREARHKARASRKAELHRARSAKVKRKPFPPAKAAKAPSRPTVRTTRDRRIARHMKRARLLRRSRKKR